MIWDIITAFLRRAQQLPELPPLHINEDGWLEGEDVTHVKMHPSWHYARLSTSTGDPLALVWHASATSPGTAGNMARRRARPRTSEDRKASWHISIESDGTIVQMASAEVGCWHAQGRIKGAGPANRVSVGIELIGFERGPWPLVQVHAAMRVARAITQSYGIRRALAAVPHAQIDPKDRSDPGRPWMREHMDAVMRYAYGA